MHTKKPRPTLFSARRGGITNCQNVFNALSLHFTSLYFTSICFMALSVLFSFFGRLTVSTP